MFLRQKGLINLIVLMLIVILVACSSGADTDPIVQEDSNNKEDNTGEEIERADEIVIAARTGEMADALEAIAQKYEEDTGTKAVVAASPYDSLYEQAVLDISAGSGAYDLIMMDDPWMPEFAENGFLLPLDDYFPDGPDPDFIEMSLNLGKHPYGEGELIALPIIGNVQLFFYRNDLVEKYGVNPPETWDEVLDFATRVTEEEDDTYGYVIRGQRGNPIVSDYLPVFWAYGGEVFDDEMVPQVNSEEAIEAMDMYLKLKEVSPTGVETYDSDQIGTALTQGRVAMTIAWPSWVGLVDDPDASEVVGKVNFSAVPGQHVDTSAMIGNWMLGVSSASKHPDTAVDFLKYVTSHESQKQMAQMGGGVPTLRSLYQDEELIEQYRQFPAQLEALENSSPRPRTPLWNKVEDVWGLYLSEIVAGGRDIQEALDQANDEIAEIMQQEGN